MAASDTNRGQALVTITAVPGPFLNRLAVVLAVLLMAAACSQARPEPAPRPLPATNPPLADDVAAALSTTTTTAATSTSTTTTMPIRAVQATGDLPEGLAEVLSALYSFAVDARNPRPQIPAALAAHLGNATWNGGEVVTSVAITGELPEERRVAVVHVGDEDLVLAADEGSGWRVAGAHLASLGLGPWYGEPPRMVLILGSDARPGQHQQRFRADSIHIVTALPDVGAGAILGFPRDSWVETPFGAMKFTSLMAGRGPQVMLDQARELTGLPVEGYVVTGFRGFEGLMGELGTLLIDLPYSIPTQEWWAGFSAGEQRLGPTRTLDLARTRKGLPGGDFTRSFTQGLVMLAVLRLIQLGSVDDVPVLLEALLRHAWTDLSAADLLTLGVTAFGLDPEAVSNVVLPGELGRAGAASVVFLDPSAADVYADLSDGLLEYEDGVIGLGG